MMLAKTGPKGEPIDTPSTCSYKLLSSEKFFKTTFSEGGVKKFVIIDTFEDYVNGPFKSAREAKIVFHQANIIALSDFFFCLIGY